jgi:hypothetical protein
MKRIKKSLLMVGTAFCLLTLSCTRNNYPHGDTELLSNEVVLKWNEVAYQAFGGANYQHSLMASRINAMVHIAMHDAINAIHPKYETYTFEGKAVNANPIAAAASAAHTVLLHEIPASKGLLDSALQQSLAAIPEGVTKTNGIQVGKDVGDAILINRENDGSAGNPVVPVPVSPVAGAYQPVPPFDFYFAPFWENIKLFGVKNKDQFRCPPPPALTSDVYTAAFNEVKERGKKNSPIRTNDQTAYAKYWYEFSEAGWNRVARVVAVSKKLNLYETARLFALVDMALADAYTTGWDSKLHYNLWRPYTAIRNAEKDGNNQTTADKEWEPEQPTPPIQDYPSTHSALGNAAAVVMANILGDATSFTMPSPTAVPTGGTRSFTSFSQAAKENADSRVMAGIHFPFACEAGLELGKNIGNWITSNHLKPLNQ